MQSFAAVGGAYNLRLELVVEHSSSRGRWRQVSSCLLSKVKASNLETVPAAFGNRKALNHLGTNWSWICTKSPAFPKFESWTKAWVLVTASSSWRLHEDLTVVVFFKGKVSCPLFNVRHLLLFCYSYGNTDKSSNGGLGWSAPIKEDPGHLWNSLLRRHQGSLGFFLVPRDRHLLQVAYGRVQIHGVPRQHASWTPRVSRPACDRAPRPEELPRPLRHESGREKGRLHRDLQTQVVCRSNTAQVFSIKAQIHLHQNIVWNCWALLLDSMLNKQVWAF